MKEGVSVVIPVYNAEVYLADCLRSVISQRRRPEEVIVVDDCSTDRSASIALSFAHRGVKLIQMPSNGGSAAARNVGIRAASHELIAFQDADDLWLENHCEAVVPLLEKNEEAVLAFSRTKVFQDDDWTWAIDLPAGEPVNCFLWCAPYTRIPQMNVIARREILLAEGGYREAMRQGQDFDLFLRLSYKYPFICTHQITTLYRRHRNSITKKNVNRSHFYMYTAQKSFWDEHHGEMSEPLRQFYQSAVMEHWLEKLRMYWGRGEWKAFDFHLSQHELIPGSAGAYRAWQRRKRFAAFRPLWGTLLRAKRRVAEKARRFSGRVPQEVAAVRPALDLPATKSTRMSAGAAVYPSGGGI
ncbi:MAG TPA: glycosyltransferase family 2 protein [Bryobacteraceae bacterium]|nr:glycosyltransferase family 2 protein [Bryobacteraceae bacterium]